MICWWSWSATWSRKKRCPVIRWRSTDWSGTKRATGPAPWALWLRGWTAEENRHGDLLNAYLRLTGRVHMRADRTDRARPHRQWLQPEEPGRSLQPARLHLVPGARDTRLAQQRRPDGGQGRRSEPRPDLRGDCRRRSAARGVLHAHDGPGARTRSGGRHSRVPIDAPRHASRCRAGSWTTAGIPICSITSPIVAQRTNVYTVRDYASIIAHLVKAWDIAGRSVTGEAAQAQEELCRQPERYERLAERTAAAMAKQPPRAFSWIRDRTV